MVATTCPFPISGISPSESGEFCFRFRVLLFYATQNAHVQMAARWIDIEGLANYLGMTVVFETFAEEDRDKVGFLADGRTPLKIRRRPKHGRRRKPDRHRMCSVK